MASKQKRLTIGEVFGLVSRESWKQALRGIRGDSTTPKHRWGLSTLRILKPITSIKTWMGFGRGDRRISIYNYFNRTPVSQKDGYSICVSQVQDYRGGTLTYDSHQGTDFIIPLGTPVAAAAPGLVVRVEREFDRGGLCVMLLHEHGLSTTYNHLGRPLVEVGKRVRRGELIALSGASGIDFVASMFLSPPHVHFNTWLDGVAVDPFARVGETSLWRRNEDPIPYQGEEQIEGELDVDSIFSEQVVEEVIETCLDGDLARQLRASPCLAQRAANVIYQRNYRPSKFQDFRSLYLVSHPRRSHFDLPFLAEHVAGIHF